MTTTTEPDFYSGRLIKLPAELLNQAHNHLQDAGFYAEAGEVALCLEAIAKVYDLHEQMSKILGEQIQPKQVNEMHTCPYKEDVHGDYETLCDCDEESTYQCAQDI
jgi:hypothetical protein